MFKIPFKVKCCDDTNSCGLLEKDKIYEVLVEVFEGCDYHNKKTSGWILKQEPCGTKLGYEYPYIWSKDRFIILEEVKKNK